MSFSFLLFSVTESDERERSRAKRKRKLGKRKRKEKVEPGADSSKDIGAMSEHLKGTYHFILGSSMLEPW